MILTRAGRDKGEGAEANGIVGGWRHDRSGSGIPATAARILRGATRLLEGLGYAAIAEYTLGNGRRADILAIDGAGQVTIVEIKSSRADFAADHKWRDYLEFCDRFYFAVEPDFPSACCRRMSA